MKTLKLLRQGDVLLKPIKELPVNLTEVKCEKRIILAEGEATGHAHAINNVKKAAMFLDKTNNKIYLMVVKPTKVEHEEHGAINLPIGNYEVIRQREYTPERIRYVAD